MRLMLQESFILELPHVMHVRSFLQLPGISTTSLCAQHLTCNMQVTDNADLIFIGRGLDLILPKLAKVIYNLTQFALKYKDLPTLGFTWVHIAS